MGLANSKASTNLLRGHAPTNILPMVAMKKKKKKKKWTSPISLRAGKVERKRERNDRSTLVFCETVLCN